MGAGGKGGDNAAIEIFVRVKPSPKASANFAYDLAETKVRLFGLRAVLSQGNTECNCHCRSSKALRLRIPGGVVRMGCLRMC